MEWAELVLEYVKALAWPLVVGGAVFIFRRQIAAKIGDLREATTPVGGASFFDREAKELEEKAERAAERQEAEEETTKHAASEPPQSPSVPDETRETLAKLETFTALSAAWSQLNARPDFDVALTVAATSPPAAVMLAYSDVEKAARAAWTVARMSPPSPGDNVPRIVAALTEGGGLDADFRHVARNLAHLRNRVTHGAPDAAVSTSGALDFIAACESLANALTGNALSKLRHPSRSRVVTEWAQWAEHQNLPNDDNPEHPGS
jgi:hypothetical protein